MRRFISLLAGLLCCLAAPLQAGAWARAPGDVFLSFSTNLQGSVDGIMTGTETPDAYYSFYAEVGLGRRLTFGLDLGQGEFSREAVAFLRYTMTPDDRRLQVALDLGFGHREIIDQSSSALQRAGLAIGYGYDLTAPDWIPFEMSDGWFSLEATIIRDTAQDDLRWKAEATIGLNVTPRLSFLFQVLAEEWPGNDVTYGVNPSAVFDLTDATSVEVGLRGSFGDSQTIGLELGLWHRF